MKRYVFYVVIALLLVTTIFYWHRSRELSSRLSLIQERIEESRKATELEKVRYKARVAIVLDDFGYNLNNLGEVWELHSPVTLSILPNLAYSKKIAGVAQKKGIETILHLPLEPHENLRLEKDTIMTEMTDEKILEILEKDISSLPGLKGVSSHMGSKATEDERVMSIIFSKIKDKKLYFLDSIVTSRSVCKRLAKKIGIRFATRSVFLDNELDAEYIKGQIKELAKKALATERAIGIGHDRAITIAVIKEMLPVLDGMGIEVVPLSELVE